MKKEINYSILILALTTLLVTHIIAQSNSGDPQGLYEFQKKDGTLYVKIGQNPQSPEDTPLGEASKGDISSVPSLLGESYDLFNNAKTKEQKMGILEKKYPNFYDNIDTNADFTKWKIDDQGNLKRPNGGPAGNVNNLGNSELKFKPNGDFLEVHDQKTGGLISSDIGTYVLEKNVETLNQQVGDLFKKIQELTGGAKSTEGGGGGSSQQGSGGGGQEFLQIAQQMAGLAKEILGGLADSLKSNGKGKTKVEGKKEGIAATFENGAAGILSKDNQLALTVEQNDPNKPTTIEASEKEKKLTATNVNIKVPDQLYAQVDEPTKIELEGIPGNTPNFPPLTDPSTIQLVSVIPSQKNSITAAVIQENFGQYIKLLDHDLDVSGRNLIIYNLKTFNNIEAGGQDIQIFSGDIEIKIEGQRIMYPRLVKKAPYGIAQLSNKLDRENTFTLQHYENRKGLLYDNRQIASVGDVIVKHPQKDLIVSKLRENMWEN